jgi:GAF domain-containing protein
MCGRAMLCRAPITVEDALSNPSAGAHRDVFEHANVRAVLSMPVITQRGTFFGMVSVHKSKCEMPSLVEVDELRRAATVAAEAIAKLRAIPKRGGQQKEHA